MRSMHYYCFLGKSKQLITQLIRLITARFTQQEPSFQMALSSAYSPSTLNFFFLNCSSKLALIIFSHMAQVPKCLLGVQSGRITRPFREPIGQRCLFSTPCPSQQRQVMRVFTSHLLAIVVNLHLLFGISTNLKLVQVLSVAVLMHLSHDINHNWLWLLVRSKSDVTLAAELSHNASKEHSSFLPITIMSRTLSLKRPARQEEKQG